MRYDVVYVINPKEESFSWCYDGEDYEIPGKSLVPLVAFVADHLFSHNKSLEIYIDYSTAILRLEAVGGAIATTVEKIYSEKDETSVEKSELNEEEKLEKFEKEIEGLKNDESKIGTEEKNSEKSESGFRESSVVAAPKPKRKNN